MIDNKKEILPLLNFEKDGDFYMLYIFKRKKDQPDNEKDNHQSVRTIKTYCINSIEYLEKRWDEIKHLCEHFKARAYIHLQSQNHKDVGLEMIKQIAERLKDAQNVNFKNIFDSVVGQIKTQEKRWVVDIDTKDESYLVKVMTGIEDCNPISFKKSTIIHDGYIYPGKIIESKILSCLPTKQGYHLITKPFDIEHFKKLGFKEDIQKKNPTLIFLPESLNY